MNIILIALKTILPMLILITAGMLLRRTGVMNDTSARQTNGAVYYLFLPMLVFQKVRSASIEVDLNSRYVFFIITAIVFQFLLSLCIVLLSEKNNARRGVMLQGMFHSNYLLFAVLICSDLFSSSTASLAVILGTVVVPLYALLSIIGLALFDGGHPGFFKTLLGVFLNPVTIAAVLGIVCVMFDVWLPDFAERAIDMMAGISMPLACVLLGAAFGFREIKRSAGGLVISLLMKLLIFPAILLGVSLLLGYRGGDLAVLLVLFASPVAVSTFTMAGEMGGDEKLAGQLVLFSSILSIFTFALFYFLLRYFAYL